ncbi:MAG: DinB family protein [Gemmatimonadetes bacterium]|nr:MAG: DinB family protein [Gemmatimonadota bacterium]
MNVKNPHLQQIYTGLEHIKTEMDVFLKTLNLPQLCWKPTPEKWSIADCLDHLLITDTLYFEKLNAAIEYAKQHNIREKTAYKPTLVGAFFVKAVQPGSRVKLKAPSLFKLSTEPAQVPAKFIAHESQFQQIIETLDGLDINRLKISTPLTPLIRFSVGDAVHMLYVHQQRHIQQAQALTRMSAFPQA